MAQVWKDNLRFKFLDEEPTDSGANSDKGSNPDLSNRVNGANQNDNESLNEAYLE